MRLFMTMLIAMGMALNAAPATAGATTGAGADIGVELRVVDDMVDPQVYGVVLRNHGPEDATFPSLVLDVGEQELVGHTADPQASSEDDGVRCTATGGRLSCQWDGLTVGATVDFTVEVGVTGDDVLTARLSSAGTPDPNPQGNNTDQLLLRPAVADLAVTATTVEAVVDGASGEGPTQDETAQDQEVRVDVVVTHEGGRTTEAVLRVDGPTDGAPPTCTVDERGFSCRMGELQPGARRTLSQVVPRPEPDESATRLVLSVASTTLTDPEPANDVTEVLVHARDRRPADVRRHQGAERIRTAVAVSTHLHPEGADAAVLARADHPADALAGAPLAVHVGGPILLTTSGQLADVTAAELQRVLRPGSTVHLLGGEAALDVAVADAVAALGFDVVRHAGDNRYATSAVVAAALGGPDEVAFADGDTFADAVVAAAAMASRGGALLLTSGDRLPDETAGWAGEADWAVGEAAARAVRQAVDLTGATAAETSVVVAETLYDQPHAVGLATTATFADALAGGPLTAALRAPLLLTGPDGLDPAVRSYLSRSDTVDTAHLLGGPGALSDAVERAVTELLSR